MVQRWTVPSCQECNKHLGELERNLLVRLALCIDPASEPASGLAPKVLRSLGLDVDELDQREKAHRDKLKAKIRSELMPHADVAGGPSDIPGLSRQAGFRETAQFAIPIPWAGLAIIAEKIARGCEYKVSQRYVDHRYGIRTSITNPDVMSPQFASHRRLIDFGPGCQVLRVFVTEDPNIVRYRILVWGTLCFHVIIDIEDYLLKFDQLVTRPQGIMPPDDRGRMVIPQYLRLLPSALE